MEAGQGVRSRVQWGKMERDQDGNGDGCREMEMETEEDGRVQRSPSLYARAHRAPNHSRQIHTGRCTRSSDKEYYVKVGNVYNPLSEQPLTYVTLTHHLRGQPLTGHPVPHPTPPLNQTVYPMTHTGAGSTPQQQGSGPTVRAYPQRHPHPGITPGPRLGGVPVPSSQHFLYGFPLNAWNHSAFDLLRWTHTTRSRVHSGSAPVLREGLHGRVFVEDMSAERG